MAWTYSGDPNTSTKDAIRFLTGDTDPDDELISDEEIRWTEGEAGVGEVYTAAWRVMLSIAAKFSRLADQTVGDLRVTLSQKAKGAMAMAESMQVVSAREDSVPVPTAGGISRAGKRTARRDRDRVRPWFESGQFADTIDPGAGPANPAGYADDDDRYRWGT